MTQFDIGAQMNFTVSTRYEDYEVIDRWEEKGVRWMRCSSPTGVLKTWPEDRLSAIEVHD